MSLISRYEHLQRRPRSDEARPLLEKIASQVKPIMTKRGWKVGTLAEFFPSNPSLLGLNTNSGQKINLRLRPPGSPDTFYEFDQLVLVMLHELTHNEIGPHNPSFYKLLGELEEEYYELKRKGYSARFIYRLPLMVIGEGFNSTGHHLPGLRRNEYDGRRAGLLAAQKRLDTQSRMGKGGRLGGGNAGGKSMREIVAEAAQRRIRDDKTCATEGHGMEGEEERRRAERESVGEDVLGAGDVGPVWVAGEGEAGGLGGVGGMRGVEEGAKGVDGDNDRRIGGDAPDDGTIIASGGGKAVGELGILEDPDSNSDSDIQFLSETRKGVPSPSSSATIPPVLPATTEAPPPAHSTPSSRTKPPPASPTEWSCPICTLLNPLHHLQCDACTTERPASVIAAASPAPANSAPVRGRTGSGSDLEGRGMAGVSDEDGWYCEVCTAGPRSWEFWGCAVCESVRKFG